MSKGEIKFKLVPEVDESALNQAKAKMQFSNVKTKIDVDISEVQKSYEKLNNEYISNKQYIKEINEQLKQGKTLTDEQQSAYNKAKEAVVSQKKELSEMKNLMKDTTASATAFGDELDKSSKSFTERMATLGLAVQGIKQVTSALGEFTTPFIEFDKQVKNIGTLGVKNFEDFRDAAIEASKSAPDSISTITAAVYDAISSSAIDVDDSGIADVAGGMEFIATASKLAVAGMTDTGAAVKSLAAATNSYGQDVLSANNAADILFATVKYGVTSIPDLNQSLSQVTPIAAAAGVGLDQVGAALATLTKQGVPTAQAATQIRSAITELMKPGANLKKVMDEAGVSMESLKQEGLQETMRKLGESMNSMGTDAANTFSSIMSIQFALSTTGNQAQGAVDDLKAIQAEAGAVEQAFAISQEGIGVKTQLIMNHVQAFAAKMFSTIGDSAVVAIEAFNKLGPTITTFASLKSLIPKGMFDNLISKDLFKNAISTASGFARTLLSTVIPSLFSTATAQAGVSAAAAASGTAFSAAGTAGVASGTAVQAAWWPVTAPILAIVGAIAAIGGAFALLYKYSSGFSSVVDNVFGVIKSLASEIFDVISATASSLYEIGKTIYDVIVAPVEIAFGVISDMFNTLSDIVGQALSALFDSDASQAFAGIFDGLKSAILSVGEFFKPIQEKISEMVSTVQDAIGAVVRYLEPVGEFIAGTIVLPIKVLWEILKKFVKFIFDGVVAAFKSFYDAIKYLYDFVKSAFITVFEKIAGYFKAMGSSMSEASSQSNVLMKVLDFLRKAVQTLFSPFSILIGYFQKAGDMATYVKGMMSGLSETFTVFKDILGKAWSSLTSLDIKGFTSALGSLPKELANGFNRGFDAALNKQKAVQKAKETAKAVTDEAKKAAQVAAQPEISEKTTKASKTNKDKTKLDLLAQYEVQKKILEAERDTAEQTRNNYLLAKGLSKTAQDDLASHNAKAEVLKKQKQMLEEIASKYSGKVVGDNIVGLKLDDDNAKRLQDEYAKVLNDINKSELTKEGIQIKINIDSEKAQKELKELERKKTLENLEMQVQVGIISNVDYNQKIKQMLLDDIADLNKQLEGQNELKIEFSADDQKIAQIEKDIDKITEQIKKKNLEIQDANAKIADAMFFNSVAGIQDAIEKERKIKLYELAKTYDKQLKEVKGNKALELKVIEDFAKQEAQINAEYAAKNAQTRYKYTMMVADAFTRAFSNLQVVDNSDKIADAKNKVKDIEGQMSQLDEAYRKGEKSYAEYISELNKLDAERLEAKKQSNMALIDLEATLKNALSESFANIAQASQENINQLLTQYQNASNESAAISEKIQTTFDPDELNNLYEVMAKKNEEASQAMSDAWTQFGINTGAVFAQMLADGNSFLKATVMAALSGLKAIIPIFIAQIFAKEIASKSFAGIATAGILTGVLTGLVTAAESAVKKMKFEKGGEIPGGEKSIIVNEKGTEFVVNHLAYAKNKLALQEINRRKITIEQYAREKNLIAPALSKNAEFRLARLENVMYNVERAVLKVEQAVHSSTHRNESYVKMEFNDKELVSRYDISRAKRVRSF